MRYSFKNKGTCSVQVAFDIEDGIIRNVEFLGGCHGNAQGISGLAEGRNAREVAELIKGIRCGFKKTSCPDQLSRAIEQALAESAVTDESSAKQDK
ncbi:MAG TPA: TIGR03905 family TSCPD domain-containing protein [Thermoclostridium sp.]|nr:TIGR03905 family TSCPD domain-containing protein [Thermoclostridium sp.]HPU44987.1 TIGR03905 family TSCPD domain-containing protein [Thermoclostridium sp.]